MFELSQLRCFVAVGQEMHFGRAAERLNMTQPPLSRQIRLLEHQVGTPLLERTSRVVRFTAAWTRSLTPFSIEISSSVSTVFTWISTRRSEPRSRRVNVPSAVVSVVAVG